MAGLKIAPNARCMIAGCRREVTHMLGMRGRRLDTGADWAPNIPEAIFCTKHATSGARIHVMYEATDTGEIVVDVMAGKATTPRATPIRRRNGGKI